MTSVIRLDKSGHTQLDIDRTKVDARDPEALAAVTEAERMLRETFAAGGIAVAIMAPGEAGVRTDRLDLAAHKIVLIPRLVGG